MLYAGCLDSDPYHSLKSYDRIIIEGFRERGIQVRELHKELSKGQILRKLNRNLLYPWLVKASLLKPKTSNLKPLILHIGSQCYAHLIPMAQSLKPNAQCLTSITVHGLHEHFSPYDLTKVQLRRWYSRCSHLKQADLIFAVSNHVKTNLVELFNVEPEKIVVNYEGISDVYLHAPTEFDVPWFRKIQESKRDHFLILSVGTNLRVKNMESLLRAVQLLKQQGVPVKLVKAGENLSSTHKGLSTRLGIDDEIIDLGFLNEQELNVLYRQCHVLSFPSRYEGFGLPVLEAQKCGLPCVISNAASLPEVGGSAALNHDPKDVEQLADQLQQVYEDQPLRDDLSVKGFANAQRFSWGQHVDTLINSWKILQQSCLTESESIDTTFDL